MSASLLARTALALCFATSLAACGETGGGLAPGLVAGMNAPGATLDRGAAFDLLNQYRATTGAGALTDDANLDAEALTLAQQYAASGTAPKLPPDATGLRVSAGYANFADTFSGWRNNPSDAAVLADAKAHKAGLASFYSPNSGYGVYWVLLVAG